MKTKKENRAVFQYDSKTDRDWSTGEYPSLAAEHADSWHDAEAHPDCPECKRAAKKLVDKDRGKA